MTDLLTGLALVLVVEGLIYALFPDAMKRFMALAIEVPGESLRAIGLAAAVVGLGLVWLLRG